MAMLTKDQQAKKLGQLETRMAKKVDKSTSTRDIPYWQMAEIDSFLDCHKPLTGQWGHQGRYYDEMIRTLNSGNRINWRAMSAKILGENSDLLFIG